MWKTLKEIIKNEPLDAKEVEDIDFEILDNIAGCNIADKFNLYHVQSVNNIVNNIVIYL